MTLEDVLKPVKWVDEQVLRQYTKVGVKLHLDEGNRRYMVAAPVSLFSGAFFGYGFHYFLPETPSTIAWWPMHLVDWLYSYLGMRGRFNDDYSGTKAVHPVQELGRKYNSKIRLPIFLTGAAMVGKGVVDITNYFISGEPIPESTPAVFNIGGSLLGLASSMYIKEIDPKILQKKPFWQRALDAIKEGYQNVVGGLAPQPQPIKLNYQGGNYEYC